jgi:hypothetical protein
VRNSRIYAVDCRFSEGMQLRGSFWQESLVPIPPGVDPHERPIEEREHIHKP